MAEKDGRPRPADQAEEFFIRQFRDVSARGIGHLSSRNVPLSEVHLGHVRAAFDLLEMSLRSLLMLRGILPPPTGSPPAVQIRERADIFRKMMELIGEELVAIDPSHEYAVGLIRRRKGTFKP